MSDNSRYTLKCNRYSKIVQGVTRNKQCSIVDLAFRYTVTPLRNYFSQRNIFREPNFFLGACIKRSSRCNGEVFFVKYLMWRLQILVTLRCNGSVTKV